MSLNNVPLSLQLVADLYKNNLVENHAIDVPKSASFKHLGANHKNILIVVKDQQVAFLSESDLNFLTSILTACKLSMADVAVVNMDTQSFDDYHLLINYFESNVILLFGVSPEEYGLPLQFPYFQVQKFEGQIYISAPALVAIANDKSLKGKLWNSLKTIFSI